MSDEFDLPQSRLLPEWCKPVGIVKLDEGCLGLRVVLPSGERMTMPLGQATFKQLVAPYFFMPR